MQSVHNFRNTVLPASCPNYLTNYELALCTKSCQVFARQASVCSLRVRAYSRALTPSRPPRCRKCPKVSVTDCRSSADVCNTAVIARSVQCTRALFGEEKLSRACLQAPLLNRSSISTRRCAQTLVTSSQEVVHWKTRCPVTLAMPYMHRVALHDREFPCQLRQLCQTRAPLESLMLFKSKVRLFVVSELPSCSLQSRFGCAKQTIHEDCTCQSSDMARRIRSAWGKLRQRLPGRRTA